MITLNFIPNPLQVSNPPPHIRDHKSKLWADVVHMLILTQEIVHRLPMHVEVLIHDGYGQFHREQYLGQ